MAFGVHALYISIIVVFLGGVSGTPAFSCPNQAASDQPAPRADSRSAAAPQSGSRRGADSAANDGAGNLAVGRRLIGGGPSDLSV